MTEASTLSRSSRPSDAPASVGSSEADRFVRRVLRVTPSTDPVAVKEAQRAMSTSLVVSGLRCLLTYLVIPLAGPTALIGNFGHPLSALLCVLAIYMSTRSMRRFWRANHRYRWHYTIFAVAIISFLTVGLITDIISWVG